MTHLIKVPRCALIFVVLIVFFLLSPIVTAKHVIVIYDVSGSMISLKIDGRTNTYMESEDIRRVNDYVMGLLFTDTSQSLRDMDDSYIKECAPAYIGKPLYQTGDILTYAEYADQRYTKINREEVRQDEFQRKLPDSTKLKEAFHGQVSYLLRAEVEVYDMLYSAEDDETYWIFVTDGDIDNSGKSDPGISSVLKQHAKIEDAYYAPRIFGVFVNNHVKIEVRQIQKTDKIRALFIANRTAPGKLVKNIQLSKDDTGQFISETLTIDTRNPEKSKFKLNSVNVEVVDKYNRPPQIVGEDNTVGVLEVMPVLLDGNSPPYEFRISFPTNPEIAAPGNALKLEVTYSYDGIDQKPYSVPPLAYTAVIDNIYVSEADNPDEQISQLTLQFSEDMYHANLIIQSESPNKKAFKINQIQCHIQYKDGRKLCDAEVSTLPNGLAEPFNLLVSKEDRLDWYGNKLLLDIDYEYEGIPPNPRPSGFPSNSKGAAAGFRCGFLLCLWLFCVVQGCMF